MKLKLSGMRDNTMDKKYHMYDVTSPIFQDKEINIPNNEIIDSDVLPPPTRKFLFTFKPIDNKLIIVEQKLNDDEDYEPEKVDGMRYAYGHTDMIGDCPTCGLTVYKRINVCYCGACGQRIKWE